MFDRVLNTSLNNARTKTRSTFSILDIHEMWTNVVAKEIMTMQF